MSLAAWAACVMAFQGSLALPRGLGAGATAGRQAGPMLALGETDLVVARQFCCNLDPAWLSGVSEVGRAAILERLTMLVAVDAQERWHVRYQDFSVQVEAGATGDHAALGAALRDRRFELYRCLKLRELPPQLGSSPKACDWTTIRNGVAALPEGADKARMREVCGKTFNELPEAELRQLLERQELGDWVAESLSTYLGANDTRVAKVRELAAAPLATEGDVGDFAAFLGGLAQDDFLMATHTTKVGSQGVWTFEVGEVLKLYVKGDAESVSNLAVGQPFYTLTGLRKDVADGLVAVGAGRAGSQDVLRLEERELRVLFQRMAERDGHEPRR